MMKKLKSLLYLALAGLQMLAFAACGPRENENDANKTKLKVSYFKAGYGEEWIVQTAKAFEKKHPDVKVVLEGNFDMENIVKTRFDSKDPSLLSDVFTVCNPYFYLDYQRKGYLEDLTSMYNEEVENGKTSVGLVDPRMNELIIRGGKYYGVPWTGATTGIVYNVKMFEKNHWQIPSTMDEFVSLCYTIKDSGTLPLVYCGAAAEGYFLNPMIAWFAQYEGTESFEEFFKYESADVYKKEGRLKAYEQVARIICDNKIVSRASKSYNHLAAQREFIKGNAAMIVSGSWIETEMSEFLSGFPEFEMAMMPMPFIKADKTDKDGNPALRTNTASGDVFVIPAQAAQKELAKEFLKFMNTQEMLELFVKTTGGNPRPVQIDRKDWSKELNTFGQSVMEIWQNSYNIFQFSTAEIYQKGQIGPFLANSGSPVTFMSSAKTVEEGKNKALQLYNDDYAIAVQRFTDYG